MGLWLNHVYTWGPFFLFYAAFAVPALLALRTRHLDETTRAVWALVIVSAPVLGSVAFAFLAPGRRR